MTQISHIKACQLMLLINICGITVKNVCMLLDCWLTLIAKMVSKSVNKLLRNKKKLTEYYSPGRLV